VLTQPPSDTLKTAPETNIDVRRMGIVLSRYERSER
jgi:hypothetical protein|tara:strand:- start:426 stop:533 length:108 start_codon:yes stop_codon:yes gene_type:complete